MRKVLFSLAAAGAALVATSPAAAQFYPAPQGYGSGYIGYGNGYGMNNYGQVRMLQARIDRVQWQINRLDHYNVVRDGRADRLREESRQIEHRLHAAARYGLNPYEANDIQARIARLEQRVQYASANRYGNGYGYNGGYGDRDDRYEREHERWHENHDGDDDGD